VLFDRILIVDWSGASKPVTGKNSIWACLIEQEQAGAKILWLENFPTRAAFMMRFEQVVDDALKADKRLLAGFDFAFGYPAGTAERVTGQADWQALWRAIAIDVQDTNSNANNRFEVAASWNRKHFSDGARFWGRPQSLAMDDLTETKPPAPIHAPLAFRISEQHAKGAKSVWQLAYAGSVGSQSLLGIARLSIFLDQHSERDKIAVWPFETGFSTAFKQPVVLAEIYPSLFEVALREGDVKDAAQVRHVAQEFARFDAAEVLGALFARPLTLSDAQVGTAANEEGWVLGIGHENLTQAKESGLEQGNSAAPLNYIRDPAEIYRQSFDTIRREADLARFPDVMQPLAIRLIHACGMVDLANDIVFSVGAFEAGAQALADGAKIFCDAEMVRHGIISRLLPAGNEVVCLLNDVRVRPMAAWNRNTRSAAQVDLWASQMQGAVIAIGNAPTALFRLLELLDQGAVKPALILGFPVGFVGAAESKAELVANSRGVPFIAVQGRRGGSAMASAAVNALAGGLGTNV
jgi:precorrin-8X/cobalt-precorrin-8 methylmutase